MRRQAVIVLLMSVVILMMAGTHTPLFKGKKKAAKADSTAVDSVQRRDSLGNVVVDTTQMDSLERAIYRHNKVVDDSIRLDSLNRKRSGGIEAPIEYTANDSLVYDARTQTAHLFGSSNVKYQNMDLASDKIYMSLDSSLVHATGTRDSSVKDGVKNKPVFTMGQDKYETDTIAFNFKTKKAYIDNVYTEQEDGFLRGERSKRDSTGVIYLEHGRYTTCDEEHPDFYIALSRARVRPGKDVVFGPAYLVVADVPLPLAIPYGFFPFTKRYSSGFIMPSYGDEQARGFYLKDIGYYFALSDKWDLKLLGEIYTRGSWGFSAASNYRKRYRYNGSFLFSYQDSVEPSARLQGQSLQFVGGQCQFRHIKLRAQQPQFTLQSADTHAEHTHIFCQLEHHVLEHRSHTQCHGQPFAEHARLYLGGDVARPQYSRQPFLSFQAQARGG